MEQLLVVGGLQYGQRTKLFHLYKVVIWTPLTQETMQTKIEEGQ